MLSKAIFLKFCVSFWGFFGCSVLSRATSFANTVKFEV